MPFPDSPRVIYDKNPLVEVICQLRFPTILRIDSEAPAAFQERVRSAYPVFLEHQTGNLGQSLPPEMASMAVRLSLGSGNKIYEFTSTDGMWTVNLTKDYLSLASHKYRRWEEFKSHLRAPLESLVECYAPSFFSRIGLRYQDAIIRSALDLADVGWSDLIKPYVAGELSQPALADNVEQVFTQSLIRLDNAGGRVRVQHGLAQDRNTGEPCYVIDSDFFTEGQTETNDVINILDQCNQQAGRLFRWCITDRLHHAMGPQFI